MAYEDWYRPLLRLYPRNFREQMGESMEQTFRDLCRERRDTGENMFGFVLWIYADTCAGIIKENLADTHMNSIISNPKRAALVGVLLILPFLIMNFLVATTSFVRVGAVPLLALILLGLLGGVISALPLFRKNAEGKRTIYVLNAVIAIIVLGFFIWLSVVLGEEIYRCDVLQIPNCD